MENIIFDCYCKWLKDKSKRTNFRHMPPATIFLVVLLFVTTALSFIAMPLSEFGIIPQACLYMMLLAEVIVIIIACIYNNITKVENCRDKLNNYQKYCEELCSMLSQHGLNNDELISDIASREKSKIDIAEKRLYSAFSIFISTLVIPSFLSLADRFLDTKVITDQILTNMMICLFLYALVSLSAWLISFNAFDMLKSKRKLFVNDLQAVVNFHNFNNHEPENPSHNPKGGISMNKNYQNEIENYCYLYENIENDVLRKRVKGSFEYYINMAVNYKTKWNVLSFLMVILPAIATFIACIDGIPQWSVALITAATSVISGIMSVYKYADKKNSYRNSAEVMKAVLSCYHNRTGKFNSDDRDRILSERIEKIIKEGRDTIFSIDNDISTTENNNNNNSDNEENCNKT